ncbi:hypothetical protein P4388_06130 [Bacillus thuringiensis]|uniref:hypothetical protein n=1 Tax=Bacillus cereus group TaxID=86661 RepID=UPI000A36A47F|nr:hypothetical protein [Bacillus thuringiensis]MDT3494524.1 TM1802 family CRISPR-associated protein [Bacillus toyonensis]MED3348232.1 hypothetical protein [Bacillus thuringiensis]MRB09097.1 hypothetical protein [Bacillus thuringiensis]OTW98575.1 hypothetical protein BK711_15975 [Bacillus thuringiensis serovar fukuokaensis]
MGKCRVCKAKSGTLIPIYKSGTLCGDIEDYSGKFICEACLEESLDYATCVYCGEEGVYYYKDLSDDGSGLCCDEHYGEGIEYDEDEDEDSTGWRSLSTYCNDPNHWPD